MNCSPLRTGKSGTNSGEITIKQTIYLEECASKTSLLRRIHPRAQLLVTAVFLACTVSFSPKAASGLAAYLLYPAVLLPLADIPYKTMAKRIIPALPFALMGGTGNLILMKKTAFVLGAFAPSEGAVSFAVIMVKTILCVSAVLILAGAVPFHALCAELRRLHVPAILCLQLAMTYRYIAVLLEEASAMYTAYTLRSASALKMKDTGFFLGRLVLRSMDKAERVYAAMQCRGFAGEFIVRQKKMRTSDYLYAVVLTGIIAALRFFNLPRFLGGLFNA